MVEGGRKKLFCFDWIFKEPSWRFTSKPLDNYFSCTPLEKDYFVNAMIIQKLFLSRYWHKIICDKYNILIRFGDLCANLIYILK